MRIFTKAELNVQDGTRALVVIFGIGLLWPLYYINEVFFQEAIDPEGVRTWAILVALFVLPMLALSWRILRPKSWFWIDVGARTVQLFLKRELDSSVSFEAIGPLTATSINENYVRKGVSRARTRYVIKSPAFEEYLFFCGSAGTLRGKAAELAELMGAELQIDL